MTETTLAYVLIKRIRTNYSNDVKTVKGVTLDEEFAKRWQREDSKDGFRYYETHELMETP